MAVLDRSSAQLGPGFPVRPAFEVVVEAHAEQLFEQQAQVYLGGCWWWELLENRLFYDHHRPVPEHWLANPHFSMAVEEEPSVSSFDVWFDDLLWRFTHTRFS